MKGNVKRKEKYKNKKEEEAETHAEKREKEKWKKRTAGKYRKCRRRVTEEDGRRVGEMEGKVERQ